MRPLASRQLVWLVLLLVLIFSLPLVLFLTKQRQDIRPKALLGAANFKLNSSLGTRHPATGEEFDVRVDLQITNANVRLSGVDFILLYDKNNLEVSSITPNAGGNNRYFDEAPIQTSGGSYNDKFNFLRVAEVSRKAEANLRGGSLELATIKFRARQQGTAEIKFPDDNSQLQAVGVGPYKQ